MIIFRWSESEKNEEKIRKQHYAEFCIVCFFHRVRDCSLELNAYFKTFNDIFFNAILSGINVIKMSLYFVTLDQRLFLPQKSPQVRS